MIQDTLCSAEQSITPERGKLLLGCAWLYLDPGLRQVDLHGDLLPGVDVGVVGLLEGALQLLQLGRGEGGADPALLALLRQNSLVAGVHLVRQSGCTANISKDSGAGGEDCGWEFIMICINLFDLRVYFVPVSTEFGPLQLLVNGRTGLNCRLLSGKFKFCLDSTLFLGINSAGLTRSWSARFLQLSRARTELRIV